MNTVWIAYDHENYVTGVYSSKELALKHSDDIYEYVVDDTIEYKCYVIYEGSETYTIEEDVSKTSNRFAYEVDNGVRVCRGTFETEEEALKYFNVTKPRYMEMK